MRESRFVPRVVVFLVISVLMCLAILQIRGVVNLPSTKPKLTPPEMLEGYLINDSSLSETGWEFYAVEEQDATLYAYLVFPPPKEGVTRMAPVEPELRRLCPDARWHTFWSDTELDDIELVLVKNVQADKGKAKRLLQITCEPSFNLEIFEKETLQ